MLRASIAAEAAGVPTVSLICAGFERQAAATGRGLGMDGLALAVLRQHVDTVATDEMISSFLDYTIGEIVSGLTGDSAPTGDAALVTEPAPRDVIAVGTFDDINELFAERGWSEGSPIAPPTLKAVDTYLARAGVDPDAVIGTVRPSGRLLSTWAVAVNAVMAGCRPEYMPVLVGIAQVLCDPGYGVEHSGNTTGADALVIVDGPIADELGFNHGPGALREGARANTTVGRWLRLLQRNVCGFTASEHDKATFGNSTRVVLAEDRGTLAELGWTDVATDLGVASDDGAVTLARMNSGLIVGSVFGSTPLEILPYLANSLTRVSGWDLTHVYGIGHGDYRPLLVLSPALARVFGRAGWSKDDIRQALFEQARIPAVTFERLIGEWSNLTAGRRTLHDLVTAQLLPAEFAVDDDPQRLVPIVTEPTCFVIAVAGDPDRANAYVFSNDGPHGQWTSTAITREPMEATGTM